ncbi:MAG: hypothetical protein SGJ19_27420 [Planctomycetia bacterium]|nr:hypothetical protein [Planctomycetia bacterium]
MSPLVAAETDEVVDAIVLNSIADAPIVRAVLVDERWWPRRLLSGLRSVMEWFFGCSALILGLAILATIPVLQFLSLGYLLEASGRIARTGRMRDGFVGVRKAARLGGFALGVWLCLWPLRALSLLLTDARIIDPESSTSRTLALVLAGSTLLATCHIASVAWRGGRLRSFLWPAPIRLVRSLFSRDAIAAARDDLARFVVGLRLPYYFWLGLRGFVGGWLWLLLPVTMLAMSQQAPVLGFLGGVLLTFMILYVLLAQTHFAAENRFAAMFEFRAMRRMFARAPVAFLLSLVAALVFATPLYLFKIEITPREAAWLPSLFFIVFAWPARILAGWAYARGKKRERPRFFFVRWGARALMLPVAALFAFITFMTQFTSWYGVWSLYEQHAFLVPAPFLGY